MALAYEYTIELCRTRPAFERFATVSIAESVAGGTLRQQRGKTVQMAN